MERVYMITMAANAVLAFESACSAFTDEQRWNVQQLDSEDEEHKAVGFVFEDERIVFRIIKAVLNSHKTIYEIH